ncbi:MAG: T9SS type A sorting domain-containing protein [Ignavibacteria bacterium]|nr:T9SS type A sorting domain-containing protein [Ignavibacteria bacterium]
MSFLSFKQNPGYYSVEFDAADLPSGIYFYRIETEEFMEIKRMILIK